MTRVTVAVCTYNRSKYLKYALSSVISQTYKDINIIVYDNASTDDTEAVVRSFADPRISYVRNKRNLGQLGNLNKALENCSTEYIVVFHDDDVMLPEMIATEIKLLDKYTNAAIVGQRLGYQIDNNGDSLPLQLSDIYKFLPIKKYIFFNKNELINFDIANGGGIICCPSVMFRSAFIKNNNLSFDEACGGCADWLLWFNINMLDSQIIIINYPIMRYRVHLGSGTTDCSNNSGAWAKTGDYIIKWLNKNGYFNTHMLESNVVVNNIIHQFTKKTKPDILVKLIKAQCDIFAYDSNLLDFTVIATGLLCKTVTDIGQGNDNLSSYLKTRRIIKHAIHSTPCISREFKWFIKYLIFMRFLKKR